MSAPKIVQWDPRIPRRLGSVATGEQNRTAMKQNAIEIGGYIPLRDWRCAGETRQRI